MSEIKMDLPIVSVIMSAYNENTIVSRAIESVLQQSYPNFELIIVDDCSTDSTLSILKSYQKKDPRIVVLCNSTNLGLTSSLIKGVSASRGRLITRIDADDFYHVDKIKRQVDLYNMNPLVRWNVVLSGEVAPDCTLLGIQSTDISNMNPSTIMEHMRTTENAFYHGAVMFEKSLYEQAGGYRPSFDGAEDFDLWLRFMEISEFGIIPEVLYYRETRETGISVKSAIKQAIVASGAIKCTRHRLNKLPEVDEIRTMQQTVVAKNDINTVINYIGLNRCWYLGCKIFPYNPSVSYPFIKASLSEKLRWRAVVKLGLAKLPIGITRLAVNTYRYGVKHTFVSFLFRHKMKERK
ncbi:glycosyltransferase [Alicyclobacillus dauci]|uniref:Glycosyltransferase n=1 Tax=Alicyclobacillus dauci TaxID=1475485 RepID=A0ABY6Z3F6_9BACL|nr:glycosyltransferase [Alicyclobacillus dauci]WAH36824.1 glycosyltransferase [Alicyclobacillus dauci]